MLPWPPPGQAERERHGGGLGQQDTHRRAADVGLAVEPRPGREPAEVVEGGGPARGRDRHPGRALVGPGQLDEPDGVALAEFFEWSRTSFRPDEPERDVGRDGRLRVKA
jgi:hypothetical protein